MSTAAPPLLAVRDLSKHFEVGRTGGLFNSRPRILRAAEGISFDLQRGQSLGLVGESGCGKSTTARCIVGLHPVTSGSIRLDGEELASLSPRQWLPHRRRVQMIFQDPYASLDPRQTVGSILAEPLAIHNTEKPRARRLRAMALLEAVGLNPRHLNRYPHEFSGGQRQRIGIARALALEPELIICDEPVSALDVSIQAQVINLLKELQQRFNLAYLFIAHDLAVVRHICERVAVMYLGRIVEEADRDTLFSHPAPPNTRARLTAIPLPDPAGEAERQRIVLAGDVPSPIDPPPGCPFHPRCPHAEEVPGDACCRDLPPLLPLEARTGSQADTPHHCACHLS
jgi:oligopeptide transport system ATP-binding protein